MQRGTVWQDLRKVKKLVSTFKDTSWNGLLTTGFALIYGVETGLGTTQEVVARFFKICWHGVWTSVPNKFGLIKGVPNVVKLVTHGDERNWTKHLLNFTGDCYLLPAIKTHANGMRKCCSTVHWKRAPNVRVIKVELHILSIGVVDSKKYRQKHEKTQWISGIFLEKQEKIRYYDFWFTACILHYGLRKFSFVLMNTTDKKVIKYKDKHLVKQMMISLKDGVVVEPQRAVKRIVSHTFGQERFHLSEVMSFLSLIKANEMSCRCNWVRKLPQQMRNYWSWTMELWSTGIVDWTKRVLAKGSLRVFETTVFSVSSESCSSIVNNILKSERNRIGDDALEDLNFPVDVF